MMPQHLLSYWPLILILRDTPLTHTIFAIITIDYWYYMMILLLLPSFHADWLFSADIFFTPQYCHYGDTAFWLYFLQLISLFFLWFFVYFYYYFSPFASLSWYWAFFSPDIFAIITIATPYFLRQCRHAAMPPLMMPPLMLIADDRRCHYFHWYCWYMPCHWFFFILRWRCHIDADAADNAIYFRYWYCWCAYDGWLTCWWLSHCHIDLLASWPADAELPLIFWCRRHYCHCHTQVAITYFLLLMPVIIAFIVHWSLLNIASHYATCWDDYTQPLLSLFFWYYFWLPPYIFWFSGFFRFIYFTYAFHCHIGHYC